MSEAIKQAVEYYKGVWPYFNDDILGLAFSDTRGWSLCNLDSQYLVCTKQQFEDYVREAKMENNKAKTLAKKIYESLNEVDYDPNYSDFDHLDGESNQKLIDLSSSLIDGSLFSDTKKMEKQKYKYVNAGIKTVGELFQALLLDEVQVFHKKKQVTINGFADVYCSDFGNDRLNINRIDAILTYLTTRQPLPWYEVEGVFPCLIVHKGSGKVHVATAFEHDGISTTGGTSYSPELFTLLTPSEAAKYGVEV